MNIKQTRANITMTSTERNLTYDDVVVVNKTMQYPVVALAGNLVVQHILNRRINEQVCGFRRYVEQELYPQAVEALRQSEAEAFPFRMYGAGLTYETTYNENCHLSLARDEYVYTGGAHGTTMRYADTFELKTGRLLELGNFFAPGTDWRTRVVGIILLQARAEEEADPGLYFEDYLRLIVENFNPDNFYLTPGGIVVFYQQYDIAPYAAGIRTFLIPYSEVDFPPTC